jgi:hypothetical protein
MKSTGRTRREKETSITFNEADTHAIIWSASSMTERKLASMGLKGEPYGGGMRWEIPKSWIRLRKPMVLSEEQKTRRGNILKAHSLSQRSQGLGEKTT